MTPTSSLVLFAALIAALLAAPSAVLTVTANDNGLALKPPLGWRSWNLYGGTADQEKMMAVMEGMAKRQRRDHEGNLVSLCDLGYCDVGLDDVWQDCDSSNAAPGMHYHDKEGSPLVNLTKFPSLSNMTSYAHQLGLTAGWYANNCACSDHCRNETECDMQIRQDVTALLEYGFDSLKIDGCGNETDLVLWNQYMKQLSPTSKPILVENCHGPDPHYKPNRTLPPELGCPYNFYRTSRDIRNNYESVMSNLATVETYRNTSYPGCWAYPDMLQVGVPHGLNEAETRSHFGAWAIVSSPLILSHDVNNDAIMDAIWPLISNREVLEVNQAYFGDSGGVYKIAPDTVRLQATHDDEDDDDAVSSRKPMMATTTTTTSTPIPEYQYLSKPIEDSSGGRIAVLLMNSANTTQTLVLSFEEVPGLFCSCNWCHVRDIWNHVDVGHFYQSWSIEVESHDTAFVVLKKQQDGCSKKGQSHGEEESS